MSGDYGQDVFRVNRWLLRCAGLWAPQSRSKLVHILYKIYAIFVFLFVNVFFTLTEFVSLFYTSGDYYSFIKNVNFFLTHLMGATKVIFWYFNGDFLIKLMNVLENNEFKYENCKGFSSTKIFKAHKKIGNAYTIVYLSLAYATLTSSYLPPIITVVFNPPRADNATHNFYEKLPYYSWMPFAHGTPGTYLLALGYQAGPMFSYAYSIVGMDALFMNIMNFIAGNFTILQGAFMTVTDRVSEVGPNLNNSRIMKKELRKMCRHLQAVFRVCEDLEKIHKFLTLGQATATLFILCTCLYLVSTTPVNSKQFFAELVYMGAMIFQLFIFCWFGNEITLAAGELPVYIWKSNWLHCGDVFKKNLIFTMARAQKPIYMTVGQFAPLTLQTFVAIVKTSYSVFTVMKTTTE